MVNRVMKINTVIGDVVLEVVSCYYPQTGRSVNEKSFVDKFIGL